MFLILGYENTFQIKLPSQTKFRLFLMLETDPSQPKVLLTRERQLSRYLTLDDSGRFMVLRVHAEPYIEGPAGELEDEFFSKAPLQSDNIEIGSEVDNSDSQSRLGIPMPSQPGASIVALPHSTSFATSVPGSPSASASAVANEHPDYASNSTKDFKEFKGHYYMERCYLFDHRGFCTRPCRYAHVCTDFSKGGCDSNACKYLHPCISVSCQDPECDKKHVKPVQYCKFEEKSKCLSDSCVMLHLNTRGNSSEVTENKSDYVSPQSAKKFKICQFFNKRSGCLSQRTATFICEFVHICDFCGAKDHGRISCPKVITPM